jgi:PBP1b-binding outer membrane lipoprotein LpoB
VRYIPILILLLATTALAQELPTYDQRPVDSAFSAPHLHAIGVTEENFFVAMTDVDVTKSKSFNGVTTTVSITITPKRNLNKISYREVIPQSASVITTSMQRRGSLIFQQYNDVRKNEAIHETVTLSGSHVASPISVVYDSELASYDFFLSLIAFLFILLLLYSFRYYTKSRTVRRFDWIVTHLLLLFAIVLVLQYFFIPFIDIYTLQFISLVVVTGYGIRVLLLTAKGDL